MCVCPPAYRWKYTHTHICLTALFPGLPGWAGARKVKPIRILLKQETVSGSGISWAICKSAPRSRQIIMPASHHSVFYRPDALPAAEPTVALKAICCSCCGWCWRLSTSSASMPRTGQWLATVTHSATTVSRLSESWPSDTRRATAAAAPQWALIHSSQLASLHW